MIERLAPALLVVAALSGPLVGCGTILGIQDLPTGDGGAGANSSSSSSGGGDDGSTGATSSGGGSSGQTSASSSGASTSASSSGGSSGVGRSSGSSSSSASGSASSGSAGSSSGSSGGTKDLSPFVGSWTAQKETDTLSGCSNPASDGTSPGTPAPMTIVAGTTTDLSATAGMCHFTMNVSSGTFASGAAGQTCVIMSMGVTQTVYATSIGFALVSGATWDLIVRGTLSATGPGGTVTCQSVEEIIEYTKS